MDSFLQWFILYSIGVSGFVLIGVSEATKYSIPNKKICFGIESARVVVICAILWAVVLVGVLLLSAYRVIRYDRFGGD